MQSSPFKWLLPNARPLPNEARHDRVCKNRKPQGVFLLTPTDRETIHPFPLWPFVHITIIIIIVVVGGLWASPLSSVSTRGESEQSIEQSEIRPKGAKHSQRPQFILRIEKSIIYGCCSAAVAGGHNGIPPHNRIMWVLQHSLTPAE